MSATTIDADSASLQPPLPPAMSPRTRKLLHGAIVPTLLGMAWPNILVMLAQASTGLIETWWVAHLGSDALTGMALVFPGFMMMTMISGGAMGGGISSAIARALGGGRRRDADALVVHAILINGALGLFFSALLLLFGRPLYAAMGGQGASLEAAMLYSNVVFGGTVLVWLMNALASVIRGTGNMFVPAMAICIGVVLLVPLSPALIFGFGPLPAMGIVGGGLAVLLTTTLTAAVLGWYVLAGHSVVRVRWSGLQGSMLADILRVGAVGSISTLQTSLTILLATALVGAAAGPAGVAGYGTGGRLEYLLIPVAFGFGGPMVALVGTNIGAGQPARALRIALTGGCAGLSADRGDRHRRGNLAICLVEAVRQRPADAGDRRRLPAHRGAGLRLLRSWPVAVFRLARRGSAAVAAVGRAVPDADCRRRRRSGTVSDWFAAVVVRVPGAGAGDVRHDPGDRD